MQAPSTPAAPHADSASPPLAINIERFVDRVWIVDTATAVTPGSLYVFLSDNVLLTSPKGGTPTVGTANGNLERHLLRFRSGARKKVVINYRAARSGVHYVDVFARRGADQYTLRISRRR